MLYGFQVISQRLGNFFWGILNSQRIPHCYLMSAYVNVGQEKNEEGLLWSMNWNFCIAVALPISSTILRNVKNWGAIRVAIRRRREKSTENQSKTFTTAKAVSALGASLPIKLLSALQWKTRRRKFWFFATLREVQDDGITVHSS